MKVKPALTTPLYICVIFILTSFSPSLISFANSISANPFLSVAIIQFLVFLLPTAFYCQVRKIRFFGASGFKIKDINAVPLTIEGFLMYFAGIAILKYVGYFFLDGAYVNTPNAVDASVYGSNKLLVVICLIALPAILEELVFRRVILGEYRMYGGGVAVIVSSLAFAMLHFSFENFLFYFYAGLVLGMLTVVCDSCLPAIILHVANNAINITFEESFLVYIRQLGGMVVFLFALIAIFLIFLILMLSRAEHMYFRKSEHTRAGKRHALESRMIAAEPAGGDGGESGIELTFGKLPARLREVFLSPTLFVMIAYFLLKAAEFL